MDDPTSASDRQTGSPSAIIKGDVHTRTGRTDAPDRRASACEKGCGAAGNGRHCSVCSSQSCPASRRRRTLQREVADYAESLVTAARRVEAFGPPLGDSTVSPRMGRWRPTLEERDRTSAPARELALARSAGSRSGGLSPGYRAVASDRWREGVQPHDFGTWEGLPLEMELLKKKQPNGSRPRFAPFKEEIGKSSYSIWTERWGGICPVTSVGRIRFSAGTTVGEALC